MTLLADAVFLLSPWKPLIIWAPFIGWAWLLGTKLDSDARGLRLNPTLWNTIHLCAAIAAFAVMLFAGSFYVSWILGMVVLAAPILIYWKIRNAEVPAERKFKLFGPKGEEAGKAKIKKKRKRGSREATLVFKGPAGEFQVPAKDDDSLEAYLQLEGLLLPAITQRASRVDMALGSGGLASARIVHTLRTKQDPLDASDGARVVNLLKEIAGLDLNEIRRHQNSEFSLIGPASKHTITITVTGSSKGQILRLDVDQAKNIMMSIDTLGLLPAQRTILSDLAEAQNRHGIVLLTSPQGQGITTSGLSILTQHDAYTSNLKVLERRSITNLEGIDHIEWDPSNPDLDFATNLQSILRRDPDVVLAEVPDEDTAQVAARSGRDASLQYLTFNADSVAMAIREWCRLVGDVDLATKPLRAIVCQRLVRVLCPDCKQQFTPDDPKKYRLKEGAVLYRAGGQVQVRNRVEDCETCGASGYTGVSGIFEVLSVDEECRHILASGDLKAAMIHARRNKMLLLQEVGLQRAASGITSIEEVLRVLGGNSGKPATKPAAKPAR
jgi:type II secretory ATPase GspE/PulE/Tfp pilus assembly ATPase PilB-like protein